MAVSTDNVTGGPAQIQFDDTQVSHTQGGVTVTVTPEQRQRVVDQYGSSPVELIHTGDQVRITAPLAEWTLEAMQQIYEPGNDQLASSGTDYLGVGRSGGFIYTTRDIKVTPFLTANAGKNCQFYACAPIGELTINHNNSDDRVFNAQYAALVDESQTDGELIGKIFLNATS